MTLCKLLGSWTCGRYPGGHRACGHVPDDQPPDTGAVLEVNGGEPLLDTVS